jgi:hypothetical protein
LSNGSQLVCRYEKATHGAQTHLSHFRRENTTQVWLPKQSTTQTAVAKGTTMPQRKRYIGGLRGGPEVGLYKYKFS